jgi:pimeloyl-ACP methyl ester carboxylesterase
MPYAPVGSIELYYELSGPEDGEPLVLIHGLGAQLIAWYPGFCELLEDAGFRVIRFDNRDAGLSTKLDGTPYELQDMADDIVGLLDHLGVESAHVTGISMGGMLAQQVGISHPDRVRSLCIICSTPSNDFLIFEEEVQEVRNRPPARTREEGIQQYIEQERISGLDDLSEEWIQEFAAAVYDRGYHPKGQARQYTAVLDSPDRTHALKDVRIPTVVVHGRDDRLISFRGGIAIAEAVPDAELLVLADMGHQVRPRLWPEIVGAIRRTADRADDRA